MNTTKFAIYHSNEAFFNTFQLSIFLISASQDNYYKTFLRGS
jgi:hypothetical protein